MGTYKYNITDPHMCRPIEPVQLEANVRLFHCTDGTVFMQICQPNNMWITVTSLNTDGGILHHDAKSVAVVLGSG